MQQFQNAIDHIELNIGIIHKLAPIYSVPADQFVGEEFYNSCALVHTQLTVIQTLKALQEIEIKLGREKRRPHQYENRPMDLDILLYDREVINTQSLVIPHPRMQQRNFVMQPLSQIAPDLVHPVLHRTVKNLSEQLPLLNKIIEERPVLSRDTLNFDRFSFIAIEGNIGSGKTSLAQKIAADFNGKKILERFAENPFLPKFYEDKQRYAFPLEMSFLADRYQQLVDEIGQHDLFYDFKVSDYFVIKSLIFSKITLSEQEYDLYHRLFHIMYTKIVKPDLYIYLHQTEDRLLTNIKTRGRDFEKGINENYLVDIQKSYLKFLNSENQLNIKIIDVSNLDFVASQCDYLKVLEMISCS